MRGRPSSGNAKRACPRPCPCPHPCMPRARACTPASLSSHPSYKISSASPVDSAWRRGGASSDTRVLLSLLLPLLRPTPLPRDVESTSTADRSDSARGRALADSGANVTPCRQAPSASSSGVSLPRPSLSSVVLADTPLVLVALGAPAVPAALGALAVPAAFDALAALNAPAVSAVLGATAVPTASPATMLDATCGAHAAVLVATCEVHAAASAAAGAAAGHASVVLSAPCSDASGATRCTWSACGRASVTDELWGALALAVLLHAADSAGADMCWAVGSKGGAPGRGMSSPGGTAGSLMHAGGTGSSGLAGSVLSQLSNSGASDKAKPSDATDGGAAELAPFDSDGSWAAC